MAGKPGKGADEDALHRYWVAGEGLARWAESPHPWTALHRLLSEYLSGAKLDATTSKWHYEVFHQHTGSDAYRAEHGGKMRGKRIGRG
jgi:hypothetical protein